MLLPTEILRRCRPGFETLVEITVTGSSRDTLASALTDAFRRIQHVYRSVNFFDPQSELSLLHRTAWHKPVPVSRLCYAIIGRALQLARTFPGSFDPTVATKVTPRSKLLALGLERPPDPAASWKDILLLPRRRIVFLRPLLLDLGGIAKGYAVDAAIRCLRLRVSGALVNAGGDLRCFGSCCWPVLVRDPRRPIRLGLVLQVSNTALATSAYPARCRYPDHHLSRGLWHPETEKAYRGNESVTVLAPRCWIADGLTKVFLLGNAQARALACQWQAKALWIQSGSFGQLHWRWETAPPPSPRQKEHAAPLWRRFFH